MADDRAGLPTWTWSVAGALVLFGLVVAAYVGDEEGINAIVYLGGVAAVVGALLGALVGGILNARRDGG